MKKRTIFRFSLIAAICGLFILQSCEKDPVKPVDPITPSNEKPYILFNGFKYYCAKQRELRVVNDQGDTILDWIGTGSFDTMLFIKHVAKDIKVGTYVVDSTGFPDPGGISTGFRWGTNISSPNVNLVKGNYQLKRENGKFVSYLKNGEAINGVNHKQRFYNIEFKVIWPY